MSGFLINLILADLKKVFLYARYSNKNKINNQILKTLLKLKTFNEIESLESGIFIKVENILKTWEYLYSQDMIIEQSLLDDLYKNKKNLIIYSDIEKIINISVEGLDESIFSIFDKEIIYLALWIWKEWMSFEEIWNYLKIEQKYIKRIIKKIFPKTNLVF